MSLDVELAKDIVDSVSSDSVVIVCKDAELLGDDLICRLCGEIAQEFPSVNAIPEIIGNRHYENVVFDKFWTIGVS